MNGEAWDDPRLTGELTVFCVLPEGPVRSLEAVGNKLYAETDAALYEILADGSYIGVRKS